MTERIGEKAVSKASLKAAEHAAEKLGERMTERMAERLVERTGVQAWYRCHAWHPDKGHMMSIVNCLVMYVAS